MRSTASTQASALAWVALGAIPGALLRWALADTLVANTLGCFVVGICGLLGTTTRRRRLLVGIGFAGSLTTYSTWVLELLNRIHGGQWSALLVDFSRDGALGVGAVLLGAAVHRRLHRLGRLQLRR